MRKKRLPKIRLKRRFVFLSVSLVALLIAAYFIKIPKQETSPKDVFIRSFLDNSYSYKEKDFNLKLSHSDTQVNSEVFSNGSKVKASLTGFRPEVVENNNLFKNVDSKSVLYSLDGGKAYLQYQILRDKAGDGLKENIILKNKTSPRSYTFSLDLQNISSYKKVNGNWEFYDLAKKKVFSIPQGVMQDSKKVHTDKVSIEIKKEKEKTLLIVKPDSKWLDDPKRVYPVYVDPTVSVVITGGITDAEAAYGGLQRKVVNVDTNKSYAFNADGGHAYYSKSTNNGNTWGSNVDIDSGDTNNSNPTAFLSSTTIYAAWIDTSTNTVEVQSINTASSDTLGTKCTSSSPGTLASTYTVSLAVDSGGVIYLALGDTSTGAVAKAYKLVFSGCTFTDITTGSGLAGSITGGSRPVIDTTGTIATLVYKSSSANTSYSTFNGSEWQSWDIATAAYDAPPFATTTQINDPTGMVLSADGTQMYAIGVTGRTIYQYTMSTPWDVSTMSYASKSLSVIPEVGATANFYLSIKTDGTAIYVSSSGTGLIYQYTMSTPWDLATATYASKTFDPSAQIGVGGGPVGITFRPDGSTMYVSGGSGGAQRVYQYALATAWDISTATYSSKNSLLATVDGAPYGVTFKPDGTSMYFTGTSNNRVYQYNLSTPWDVSTSSNPSINFSVAGETSTARVVHFRPDGSRAFVLGTGGASVYQYNMTGTSFVLATNSMTSYSLVSDGTYEWLLGTISTTDTVFYKYTFFSTWSSKTAPWTGATNVGNVSLTVDSSEMIFGFILKDASEQGYYKSYYPAGDTWGTETSLGFTPGDLSQLSSIYGFSSNAYAAAVVRQGTNLEYAKFDPATLNNQETIISRIGSATEYYTQTNIVDDSANQLGSWSSIATGADGYPVIAYKDSTTDDVLVAKCVDIACADAATISVVDNTATSPSGMFITIGDDGFPIISYIDSTTDVKVAHCGNAACSSGNTLSTIQTTTGLQNMSGIAIASDGFATIAYATSTILRAAHCSNTACTSSSINDINTGTYGNDGISIAIGADNLPVIAFSEETTDDLMVAHCGNSACSSGNTVSTVDSVNNTGWFNAITINADGFPIISYSEGGSDLWVADCGNAACSSGNTTTHILDASGGSAARYSGIGLGGDGLPVIAQWGDNSPQTPQIIHCTTSTCSASDAVISLTPSVAGAGIGLTIGTDGFAAISYRSGNELYVTHCGNYNCEVGLQGSGLETKVGSIASPGSTGNASVTGLGFTPKAVLFFGNPATSDGTTSGTYTSMGMGVSASSRAAVSANNTSSWATRQDATKTFVQLDSSNAVLVAGDLVSLDADGFTVNWTTVSTGVVENYIAIGGEAITDVALKQFTAPAATGSQATTGVGFQPDAMILMSVGDPTAATNTNVNFNQFGWGFATATNQGSSTVEYDSGSPSSYQTTSAAISVVQNQAKQIEASLTSFDSDGFTLNFTTAFNQSYIWALCIKGGDFKVGSFNKPTSTGNSAVTGVGFTPTGLLLTSFNEVTNASVSTGVGNLSIGAASSASDRSSIWTSQINTLYDLDRTKIIKMMSGAGPTLNGAADLTSFDSDGFTLNWSTANATAYETLYMAMGGGPTNDLFSRLVSIDDQKLGTSSDTYADGTLFGRIGSATDMPTCSVIAELSGSCDATLFGITRNNGVPKGKRFFSIFGGDGSVAFQASNANLEPGMYQFASGTVTGTLSPNASSANQSTAGLYLFYAGNLTVSSGGNISVLGLGGNGGVGGNGGNGSSAVAGTATAGNGGNAGRGGGVSASSNGTHGSSGAGSAGGAGGAGGANADTTSVGGAGGGGGGGGGGGNGASGGSFGGGGGGAGGGGSSQGVGGNGGNGGAANESGVAGDTAVSVTNSVSNAYILSAKTISNYIFKSWGAGGAGGAGGGGGLNGSGAAGSGGGGGGGGGAGGGILYIEANAVTVDSGGAITAAGQNGANGGAAGSRDQATGGLNGGNGGNGGALGTAPSVGAHGGNQNVGNSNIGSGGGGGGGAGGGGGVIYIRTHRFTNSGTVTANAGLGGRGGAGENVVGSKNGGNGGAGAKGFVFIEIVP